MDFNFISMDFVPIYFIKLITATASIKVGVLTLYFAIMDHRSFNYLLVSAAIKDLPTSAGTAMH